MNSDIEEIKSRLNTVEVIGEYIRLEKAGVNWKARCPFHNEKTPSFMVNPEKQIWHCFGCGKGGDIFTFVMEMEGLEFREALKIMAEKSGVPLKRGDFKSEGRKSRTLEILELATKFYETQLWKGAGKEKIMGYLKDRGLKEETIRDFRLGYAPKGWRNILTFLTKRSYDIEEIMKTGLLVKKETSNQQPATNDNVVGGELSIVSYYDRFRDRIIFPIADTMGKVVGFSARVAPGGDESQAKYVNTPESDVYHKSRALYGIDRAKRGIKASDHVLLVEGNMDVIAAHQAGFSNTVAVSGTALTPDQLSIVKRYTNNLKMFFDMDKAGEEATKKSIKLCFERDMDVKVVQLPEGKDAADMAKSDPELLKNAVAGSTGAMEYFFEKVFTREDREDAGGKKKIAAEILDMISNMSSDIAKSHWIKKLGEELGIKESVLTDMLKKATLKGRMAKESGEEQGRNFEEKTKAEVLTEDLIGLMLIYESAWKKVFAEEKGNQSLLRDRLLSEMIDRSEEFQFSFDSLVRKLEDPAAVSRAEKIYFEKRYRPNLNNEIEEVFLEDPIRECGECLLKIRKETLKEELDKIERDQKAAQKTKDREAEAFLVREAQRITQELSQL